MNAPKKILIVMIVGLIAILLIIGWLLPTPASAEGYSMIIQVQCRKTVEILKKLSTKYHEEVAGAGLSGAGDQVRLFVSPENTFTIIETKPGSTFSCLYTGGTDWITNGVPKGDDL